MWSLLSLFLAACHSGAFSRAEQCSCANTTGCDNSHRCQRDFPDCRKENVALGKVATISSTYIGRDGQGQAGPACLAVNGDRSHTFVTMNATSSKPSCVHTSETETNNPFWEVDLNGIFTVSEIVIYNRNSNRGFFEEANITVDGKRCYTFGGQDEKLIINITCRSPLRGQKVRVRKNSKMFNFCEFEVWVCRAGLYGQSCADQCSGHCRHNEPCDNFNGTCHAGCADGYHSDTCKEPCLPGTYGRDCTQHCGKCKLTSRPCDHVTGACPDGCIAGYNPPHCNTLCTNSTYGENCRHKCGHCTNSAPCNITSGHCEECQAEYRLPLCQDEDADENNNLGTAVAVVIAVVLGVVIGGVVYVILRRKRQRSGESDGTQAFRLQRNKKKSTSKYLMSTALSNEARPENLYSNAKTLGQGSASSSSLSGLFNAESVDVGETQGADDNGVYTNDESIYATFQKSSPKLDSVQRHLVDIVASGQLPSMFKELPKGLTADHETGKLKVNAKKNRYASILPYDYNRVVLNDGYAEGGATDYVNASYITGFEHGKRYIASQGPRETTTVDFWRTVWQEKITQIVMLTNAIEGDQMKCVEYWPAKDNAVTYGPLTVTGVNVQRRANFLVRTFLLKTQGTKMSREVAQYHYLAWPDHGTPTTTSLLNFWRFAKTRAPRQPPPPILVHCAAGVGRTGTYIGLDIAFDQAVATGKVDVFDVVLRMRQERCIMVQATDQFVFLHKVVLEAFTGRSTTIPSDDFEAVFGKKISAHEKELNIDKEFETVKQMKSLAPEPTLTIAERSENIGKIRNTSALPADEHLVRLTLNGAGQAPFINAVFVSSYREHRGSIVTQLPLQDTLMDFWQLVDDQNVKTIVSLGSQKEAKTAKNFCQYWPLSEKTELKAGTYVIKLTSKSQLDNHLTRYTMILDRKGPSKARAVCLLRYEGWEDQIPASTSDLLALVDHLDAERLQDKEGRRVVIQCTDGVGRSGLFCAVCDVISRVTYDKEVDVYITVRTVQDVIAHAVQSVVQYRYLYEVVQRRISDLNVYANTV